MQPRTARLVFVVVGVAHVALGAWMLLAPGSFYDAIATFDPRNDHFVRDLGTFYVALGAAFVGAGSRPAWRGPVLALALVQYALHTATHLYDVGRPDEGWVGPVNLALVGAGLLFLAALAYRSSRARET